MLLRDLRPFETAFGGAMPLDDTHVAEASYGPAGMVLAGSGFYGEGITDEDRRLLGISLGHLRSELWTLRKEDFDAWASLIDPYLGDPADSGMVEDWRRRVAALDEENAEIRASNAKRELLLAKGPKAARKAPAYRHEKVRLVTARTQLERHDRAVRKLADHLRDKKLHPINPRLMSVREEAAGDAANAQVYAYYQQVRVSGRSHQGAVSATALKFRISDAEVERIVEFRKDVKLATCIEEGCEGNVFSQNLCQKHYQQQWRERKKGDKEAG